MMYKLYITIRERIASERINSAIIFYGFVVLTYQILHLIVPFRQLVEFLHLGFLSPLFAVVGLCIFIYDTLVDRVYLQTKFVYFLLVMVVLMFFSSCINYKYELVKNAKIIVWQIAQMFVIFPMYKRVNGHFFSSLKVYLLIISILFAALNLICFSQYYKGIHYLVSFDGIPVQQGFSEGRLFGVYGSVHNASVFVLILVVFSVYFACISKNVFERILYIALALVHFLYAVMSGTRSVIIGMSVALAVFAFLRIYNILGKQKLCSFIRTVTSFLLAACVMLGTVGVFTATDRGVKAPFNINNTSKDEVQLTRTDTGSDNISNNRFKIWSDYIKVGSSRVYTFLFGMSPGGYMKYIRENFPDIYIVEYIREYYPPLFAKGIVYHPHNVYLDAFVATGILGLLVLIAFLLTGFVRIILYVVSTSESLHWTYTLLIIVVFILVSSFFDSGVFFNCTSTSVIFWLTTGLLLKSTDLKAN